jgi:hypothetical protein
MDIGFRFARVLVSGLWGLIVLHVLQRLGVTIPDANAELVQQGMIILFAAIINGGVAMLSKKYPWLEWILLVGFKPEYSTQHVNKK